MSSNPRYNKLAVGGTFDHLHLGHRSLLDRAFSQSAQVIIGLTADSFVTQKHLPSLLQPFWLRRRSLSAFVNTHWPSRRYTIIPLTDVYGTTLQDPKLQALAVTQETLPTARRINSLRQSRNLSPLDLVIAPFILDHHGQKIDSSRIRRGVINRTGTVFADIFHKHLMLSASHKQQLRQPLGKLLTHPGLSLNHLHQQTPQVAVVGDLSVELFINSGINFNLAVVDLKTRRQPTHQLPPLEWPILCSPNPPGTIHASSVVTLQTLLSYPQGIHQVYGEEDLLVLPLILLLPLQSLIYYGQPGRGVVQLPVTEAAKDKWYRFLQS